MKGLSCPVRLAILDFLKDGEKTVNEIFEFVGTSQPNISKHLFYLKKLGIIDERKEGLRRFYYIKIPCILKIFSCIEETILEKTKIETEELKT